MKIACTSATALRYSLCPIVYFNLSTPQSRSSLQIRCASASSTTNISPPRVPSDESHIGAAGTIGRCLLGCAAAAATLLSSFSFNESPALAESLTVAFPVSRAREVNNVQKTLVEAWGLIRETFYDPSFNHQDWDLALQQTMIEMLPLDSSDAAYTKISAMLSSLGDPFTRIITPKEFQRFRVGSEGNLQGVGLYVTKDQNTGQLMVMSCVEGSPAARAGIHNGDQLVEINGEKLDGINSETAASRLRGLAGTAVKLKIRSVNEARAIVKEVNLPREIINLSPVSSVIIPHRSPNGRVVKTGYVKLASFSQNAATCMADAVRGLEEQKVQSYILDLRNNPGGLVTAGLDVAQIWLDGDETLVNTIDREGNLFPINMTDGHALTKAPLVVLVNEKSASASEILAGALHDNGRAILVGRKTFGKGKIQSVTELHDGAALFITVAKYLSPARHELDQVGITPDVQCTTRMLNASKVASGVSRSTASNLESDNCILVAEHELDAQKVGGAAS